MNNDTFNFDQIISGLTNQIKIPIRIATTVVETTENDYLYMVMEVFERGDHEDIVTIGLFDNEKMADECFNLFLKQYDSQGEIKITNDEKTCHVSEHYCVVLQKWIRNGYFK